MGRVSYNHQYYLFTESDAMAYALSRSAPTCATLYAPICTTVADLPPYSCSRTINQGFFSSAATAVANAQFLVQILIFLTAMLLPYLADRFPETAFPSSGDSNNSSGIDTDNSVEMVQGTATLNTMHGKNEA